MVSIAIEYDQIGDRDNLASLPYGAGIPQPVVDLTIPVPFNDAGAMERRIAKLDAEGRKPACVIMEAAMMNLGIVLPEPGYLESGTTWAADTSGPSASRRSGTPSADGGLRHHPGELAAADDGDGGRRRSVRGPGCGAGEVTPPSA